LNPAHPTHGESPHHFFIPVMGTGFTLDTPLKVARFGIDSTVSLMDDELIEVMRSAWAPRLNESYAPIPGRGGEARVQRIREYLDLLQLGVSAQVEDLRRQPFTEDSDLTRYFRMLPPGDLRREWEAMLSERDPARRAALEEGLRRAVVPGSIDVNIMTTGGKDNQTSGDATRKRAYFTH